MLQIFREYLPAGGQAANYLTNYSFLLTTSSIRIIYTNLYESTRFVRRKL